MRKTAVFIAGLAVGVYLARQIEANPEAKRTLDETGEKIRVFASAVTDGYREQEIKNSKSAKLKSAK
jgi:hypothetical protein